MIPKVNFPVPVMAAASGPQAGGYAAGGLVSGSSDNSINKRLEAIETAIKNGFSNMQISGTFDLKDSRNPGKRYEAHLRDANYYAKRNK